MEIKNNVLTGFISGLPAASQELIDKANRQIVFDGNNTFKKGMITVFLSNEVKEATATIRGQKVTYPVFAVAYLNEDGTLQGTGTVSANAISARFYPNQGEATEPINAVNNYEKYGSTAKEIVEKCIADNLCINYVKTAGLHRANWDNVSQSFNYNNMVKADRNLFEIQPIPAAVLTTLQTA